MKNRSPLISELAPLPEGAEDHPFIIEFKGNLYCYYPAESDEQESINWSEDY